MKAKYVKEKSNNMKKKKFMKQTNSVSVLVKEGIALSKYALMFLMLFGYSYAQKIDDFVPRDPKVNSGSISVLSSNNLELTFTPPEEKVEALRRSGFDGAIPMAALYASSKTGLEKTYGNALIDVKNIDVNAYLVESLIKAINEQKMFRAEKDGFYVLPSAKEIMANPLMVKPKALNEKLQESKNDLILAYIIMKNEIRGNKEVAYGEISVTFNLMKKPMVVDKSLKGKEKRLAVKKAKEYNKKSLVWRILITEKTNRVAPHRSKDLKREYLKMLSDIVARASEDLHHQPE